MISQQNLKKKYTHNYNQMSLHKEYDYTNKIREVKGDYLKYSMEIIEDMKDSQYLDKEEKDNYSTPNPC